MSYFIEILYRDKDDNDKLLKDIIVLSQDDQVYIFRAPRRKTDAFHAHSVEYLFTPEIYFKVWQA